MKVIQITADEKIRHFRRIIIVEKYIMFPAKFLMILILAFFLWSVRETHELKFAFHRYQFWMYVLGNLFFMIVLIKIGQRKFNFKAVQVSAFFLSIIDNLFLSFLIYFTTGLESEFYWLYCGLIIRNAVDFPRIRTQSMINLSFILFYIIAIYSHDQTAAFLSNQIFWLKVSVLILVSVCCWGIYTILVYQRRRGEEFQEMTVRSEKLSFAAKLAASIAHELKNPLGIIMNAAYLLENSPEVSSDLTKKQIGVIKRETMRSDRIISDLLNYSRLSEGKIEKVNINSCIDEVIESLNPEIFLENVSIIRNYRKDIPSIYFDVLQMRQIITNIVTNAKQSMPDGGALRIKTDYFSPPDRIVISFKDTGKGIDKDLKDKVFDPFVTTKSKGTGLGLAIVKSIVETYNGEISLQSSKKGTKMIVTLPIRTVFKNGKK
ncbi:MAG: hypothetical protein KAQ99_01230 [Candidatus Aureabacteria bacterium]|nr:hypothetical protein [Candidatus Auribacterota bacterium]